ncbi:MAG: hypothetical protein IPK00_06725 [Deltaproteobacteria bacterium]|nr:hypothetical protein [Deltaproteobacteria bacterium]
MNRRAENVEQDRKSRKSGLAIVVRVYWMFLGYIPMVASVASILEATDFPSAADFAFWTSVLSIALARFYDVTRLNGTTAEGGPATLADWRRHAAWLLGIATIVWAAIRILASRA